MSFHDHPTFAHTSKIATSLDSSIQPEAQGKTMSQRPGTSSGGQVSGYPPLKLTFPLKIDPWNLGDSELGNHPVLGASLLVLGGKQPIVGGIKQYKCVVLE